MNNPVFVSCSYWADLAQQNTCAGMLSANLFLLRLCLSLEAADLLLGQRHSVLLLLEGPQPKLEVCHLPLQLHDSGAL